MSSNHLENLSAPGRPASDKLLLRLKTHGPQTAALLGEAMGTTAEAARQQLIKLAQTGMAEPVETAHGVGRPTQVWSLTPAGNARFPDSHADLTVQLLQAVQDTLGERALDRLIAARESGIRKRTLAEMEPVTDLEQRISKLAETRAREGYMAEWWREGDAFMLAENHCPICLAATLCPGFCRSELELFRKVLGAQVTVTRVEHMLAGSRRCAYRIEPKKAEPRRPRRSTPSHKRGKRPSHA
jgi:predicted ArsR family transcriptional regulator